MGKEINLYKRLNKPEVIGTISLFLISFIAFGYPIQVGIPAFFKQPSRIWNISFRSVTFLLSFLLIFIVIFRKSSNNLKIGSMAIIIFWSMYILRLIFDLLIKQIRCDACLNPANVFAFAIGQSFIGAIVGVFTAKFINLEKAIDYFSNIILISLLIIFVIVYKENNGISIELLFDRKNIGNDIIDEFGRGAMLNVSYFGIYGTITSLIIIFKLFHFNYKVVNLIWKIILLIFSIFMTILSGSRSPILIFLVIFLYIIYLYVKNNKAKMSTYFTFISIILLIISAVLFILNSTLIEDFSTFQRFLTLAEASKQGEIIDPRELEWATAWKQFLTSPFFGDQIVTKYDYFYPHNIYLEVLMSLGIFGGILFLIILFQIFNKQKYFIQTKNLNGQIIFIIVLYILMDGFFGQNLWGSPYNWVMISFFINIKVS